VSGSAVGFFGGDRGHELLSLDSKPGDDFLAACTIQWENMADQVAQKSNLRLVKIRTGVVFANGGGAFPQILMPIKMFIGSPLGSGKQWVPWIHIHDIVGLFSKATLDRSIQGLIHGVSPDAKTNAEIGKMIAKIWKKPFFMPNVPAFVLKLIMGEMSVVVTGSTKVSYAGPSYSWQFSSLEGALRDLYQNA
ncbi:MAG: TIGR01777 family oxidoreductase, partial [Leadbetterella sp.]